MTFVIKHKLDKINQVAKTLSRKLTLLVIVHVEIIGFEYFNELYVEFEGFAHVWDDCRQNK